MRCSNMAAEFKNGEKPGRYPSHYTDSFTAKNTCTDNYGALYCKVRTLRLDFAWGSSDRDRSIGRLWVLRGPFQHHSSDVISVPVASCGGRMPECTSTRERFAFFFEIGAVRRLRGVFCPCSALFKAPWSLESRLVS